MSQDTLVAESTLFDAIRQIELSRRRIAVVLDQRGHLIGTLTDGDVRRCLLAGGSLETPVSKAMNASPLFGHSDSSEGYLLDLMRTRNVLAIPLVDFAGKFTRVVHVTDLVSPDKFEADGHRFEFAVIMAGGEGMRLRPITESLPKPMVEIGGVPLLERQIIRLRESGIEEFYIAVKFLGHVIEEYFEDGTRFGVRLHYLREAEKSGTAGALALLPRAPAKPILVMNGDVLTTSNLGSLLEYHHANEAVLTAAAIDYRVNIPYGVFVTDGPLVMSLAEKPSQRFLCNAGIYVLAPSALEQVPTGKLFNMTDLIATCLSGGQKVAVFPVHEYWSDIGTPAELEAARIFFEKEEAL